MRRRLGGLLALATLLAANIAPAQGPDDDYGPQPTGGPAAQAQYEANVKAHGDDPNMLVLPGLVADRTGRTVEVLAECTGLSGGETAEFLLIGKESGHGYEALLWSMAKPSDIHRALTFVGARSGAPVNPGMLRFWSTGDRIMLDVQLEGEAETVAIEELIVDNETEEHLPIEGFVFAGSMQIPMPAEEGGTRYAADHFDPRTVAALFNDPSAVLDVPRQVNQGEVYGSQVVNPEFGFKHGTLLKVIMTPRDSEAERRSQELALNVAHAPGETNLVCRLSKGDGEVIKEGASLTSVLEALAARRQGDLVPDLNLSFGDSLRLLELRKSAAVMAMVESLGMARIGPPAPSRLYFRAFLPDERWREAAQRPTQPWEVHLSEGKGGTSAEMVLHLESWEDGKLEPNLERTSFPVADGAAVRAKLDADNASRKAAGRRPGPSVLLVFAPDTMRYSTVLEYVREAFATHGTIYIFLERPDE